MSFVFCAEIKTRLQSTAHHKVHVSDTVQSHDTESPLENKTEDSSQSATYTEIDMLEQDFETSHGMSHDDRLYQDISLGTLDPDGEYMYLTSKTL